MRGVRAAGVEVATTARPTAARAPGRMGVGEGRAAHSKNKLCGTGAGAHLDGARVAAEGAAAARESDVGHGAPVCLPFQAM